MADLLELRRRLGTVNISAISRACGIPRTTIASIKDGIVANPGVLTVAAIERALDDFEAENSTPTDRAASAQETPVGDELPAGSGGGA